MIKRTGKGDILVPLVLKTKDYSNDIKLYETFVFDTGADDSIISRKTAALLGIDLNKIQTRSAFSIYGSKDIYNAKVANVMFKFPDGVIRGIRLLVPDEEIDDDPILSASGLMQKTRVIISNNSICFNENPDYDLRSGPRLKIQNSKLRWNDSAKDHFINILEISPTGIVIECSRPLRSKYMEGEQRAEIQLPGVDDLFPVNMQFLKIYRNNKILFAVYRFDVKTRPPELLNTIQNLYFSALVGVATNDINIVG